MLMNSEQRYGTLNIGLHWLTLWAMIAVYALIEFRDIFPKGDPGRDLMKEWHFMLGLLIFALVFVRLALRWMSPTPRIVPELSPVMHKLAKTGPPRPLRLFDAHPAVWLAAAERRRQAHPLLRA